MFLVNKYRGFVCLFVCFLFRFESIRFVLFGLVWFGLVWFGLVWFGLVWFGCCCLFYLLHLNCFEDEHIDISLLGVFPVSAQEHD